MKEQKLKILILTFDGKSVATSLPSNSVATTPFKNKIYEKNTSFISF